MARTHFDPAPTPIAGAASASGAARHIGVVIHRFSSGGTERVAIRLANAWAKSRRVTIFCGGEEGPARALVDPAVEVVPVAPRTADSDRGAFGRALGGMVLGMRPDIVVGPGNHHAPILRAMLDRLGSRRPAVVCKISNPLRRPERSAIGQAVFAHRFRAISRRFDRLVAMSPALAAEASVVLGRHDLACIAEPILDDDRALPLARPETGTVLCVGRLERQKHFGLAIEAFARSRRAQRLVILGEGDDHPALRDRARALGVADRVIFQGYVADVPAWLAAADALLMSSRFEGYPAVLVEALAAGTPVVTTPCSLALPEILADRSFGAIAAADADALAGALDRVLVEARRPERGPLRELMRRHRLARSAETWLEMLDAAAAERAAGWTLRQPLLARLPVATAERKLSA